MPGEDICTIINRHAEDCGEPPEIDVDEYSYFSYFENEHRDQSIFLFDSEQDEIIVYLADAGWDEPQVIPSEYLVNNELLPQEKDIGVLPDSTERRWLKACKSAVQVQIEK